MASWISVISGMAAIIISVSGVSSLRDSQPDAARCLASPRKWRSSKTIEIYDISLYNIVRVKQGSRVYYNGMETTANRLRLQLNIRAPEIRKNPSIYTVLVNEASVNCGLLDILSRTIEQTIGCDYNACVLVEQRVSS